MQAHGGASAIKATNGTHPDECLLVSCTGRLLGCLFANCITLAVLYPIHDGKDLVTLEDFFLQQRLCQAVQGIAMLGQDASCLLVGLRYQSLNLSVQELGCRL